VILDDPFAAGMARYFSVPVVSLVRSVLTISLRWLMPESSRCLASKGRIAEANAVVQTLEDSAMLRRMAQREPVAVR